ncbi:diacylglycerol/lipid kinase family protein [Streptococcus gallinaceus]|uniref:Diacylglycerol kinase family enzyme n=1 Tax=Streptococcus gallinaceus TaxID=165758 RepID=A0ABV2JMF9_9STRE
MTVYIIANPHAGAQLAVDIVEEIQVNYPHLEKKIFFTTCPNDEKNQVQLALQTWQEGDTFLVIGGDGTLSKVLYHLPQNIPFSYYPVGSGNDFARALQLPDLAATIANIEAGNTREITIFAAEEGILLNSLDLGFAAWVVNEAAHSTLKRLLNRLYLGKLTYIFIAILSLLKNPVASVKIQKNNQEILELDHVYFFSVANNTYFGGGIMIWPTATVYDSQLHMIYAKGETFWKRLAILLTLVFKQHQQSSYLQHEVLETAHIKIPRESIVEVDGEIISSRELTLKAQKRKIYL